MILFISVASKGNEVMKLLITSQQRDDNHLDNVQLFVTSEEEIKKCLLTETYISYLLKMQLEG